MNTTNPYVLVTDSGCDLSPAMLERMGIPFVPLNVFMKDAPALPCTLTGKGFYDALRAGQVACTSAANLSLFRDTFSAILKEGKDVLYLSFSSALSCMFATARIAAEELALEYPERTIEVVDSLSASMGEGLLLYYAAEQKEKGASISELAAYLVSHRLQLVHWFTVDDLQFLKRGGRISTIAAFAGTLLGVKPVMHVSDEGKLIFRYKVRGRKNSLLELAKHYHADVQDPNAQVFISHGDAMEAAEFLKHTLQTEYGAKNVVIGDVGPVIGAHSGPGTIALFYMAESRNLI